MNTTDPLPERRDTLQEDFRRRVEVALERFDNRVGYLTERFQEQRAEVREVARQLDAREVAQKQEIRQTILENKQELQTALTEIKKTQEQHRADITRLLWLMAMLLGGLVVIANVVAPLLLNLLKGPTGKP